jgi:membrane protein YdbS with pleckstrin-like domain
MIQKALQDYIQEHIHQGTNKEIIIATLTSSGWQKQDIDDSYNSVALITTQTETSAGALPISPNDITEKKYPIQIIWIIQSVLVYALVIGYLAIGRDSVEDFLFTIGYYCIYIGFHVGYIILRRRSFHYIIGKSYIEVRQGVFSKQQRHIPVGVIQNVFVKQGVLDRIFGLATLTVENAAQSGKKSGGKFGWMRSSNASTQTLGFDSNGGSVAIPGLKKQHAEELKMIILQRMKENPVEANQSGL